MPLFLVSAAVILGASLGGIDLARHASATTRLQNALDGAALAMGRLAASEQDNEKLLAEARRYFSVNFPNDYQGSGVDASKLSLSMNESGRVLTLSMDGSLPLLSTGFLDVSAAPLRAKSTVALEGNSKLEVVFAVDTSATGDMKNNFVDDLKASAAALLNGGYGSTHIGIVPYSEVVNVGTNNEAKYWVARWLDNVPPEKKTSVVEEYVKNKWTGCIAEPQPWLPPNLDQINPLNPSAQFFPVIVRGTTGLHAQKDKSSTFETGDGWALEGRKAKQETLLRDNELGPGEKQPQSVLHQGEAPTWLLWNDVHHHAQSGHSSFYLYSVHEPANCSSAPKVRFLSSDSVQVGNHLKSITQFSQPDGQHKSLPPAGLLWSWRMLAPSWRGVNGWPESQPTADKSISQAIVLITSGHLTEWTDLNTNDNNGNLPLVPWSQDAENDLKFELTYHVECHSQSPDCKNKDKTTRVHKHNASLDPKLNGWQRPVSSLAMKDPFKSSHKPKPGNNSKPEDDIDVGGGVTINNYTQKTCEEIRKNGINIFVLSPKAVISNQTLFKNCASDSQVYTNTDALREALLNLRSESSTLRLVPSRNS